ncbi:Glycolipid 2-alpha-mannosyltransferase 1 [Psilocybe cubensis]|uniref:Glycolipid 2-alpha-mannosyltransferase 1 n=1 Tax=Psilocybe cubensis TaxID=181762 RepID=A0ACB8GQW2_PSICU|nr:Glycolipid 2-alpha-mannosyltransferase 1 [Psilocybe cubensis]KAH9478013.1 Glycolipid 2-alpha-mannosyltransferase 1 [Psilocybe cubensis]
MSSRRYHSLIVLSLIFGIYLIFIATGDSNGNSTLLALIGSNSLSRNAVPPYRVPIPDEYYLPKNENTSPTRKANAAILMLARNSDLNGVVTSVKQMEDRFNKKFQYPYIFLNEQPFEEAFITRVTELTDAEVKFGIIPKEHWVQPEYIDEARAAASRGRMVQSNIIYGDRPDVKFFCDLDYDPFLLMEDQDKLYGFNVALYEFQATIPTLWDAVKEFTTNNPEYVAPDNAMDFLSDNGGTSYNLCHFWSNFEIANLDLWRSEAYTKFFEFLDRKGGFYYERWGDAPVHSMAASLFLNKSQLHFFDDIGYRHEPFEHCPGGESHKKGKCACDSADNFDYQPYSCYTRYEKLFPNVTYS